MHRSLGCVFLAGLTACFPVGCSKDSQSDDAQPARNRPAEISVLLTTDGSVTVGGAGDDARFPRGQVTQKLSGALREARGPAGPPKVAIRFEDMKASRWSELVPILRACAAAGVPRVTAADIDLPVWPARRAESEFHAITSVKLAGKADVPAFRAATQHPWVDSAVVTCVPRTQVFALLAVLAELREAELPFAVEPSSGDGAAVEIVFGSGSAGEGVFLGPAGAGADGPVVQPPSAGGGNGNIVYVLDRSGSMFRNFDLMRRKMGVWLDGIPARGHFFHVILMGDGPAVENPPKRLIPATPHNKQQAGRFLDSVVAKDQTDPVPALKRAFAVLAAAGDRPGKVIHLLTDGVFPDNEAVLDTIAAANRSKQVLIHTYLLGDRPPIAERVMRRIARENGGVYTFIPPEQ